MIKIILFLFLFFVNFSLYTIEIDRESLSKYLEEGGEKRYQAIWIAYDTKQYDFLSEPRIQNFLKEDDTKVQELILTIYNLLGESLPLYIPGWYIHIDEYLNIKRSDNGIKLSLELARKWKEKRLVFAISRLLLHPSITIRNEANQILKELNSEYQILLQIELLKSKYEIYNIYGLNFVRDNPDQRILPFVRSLSLDSNKMIKRYALRALSEYSTESLFIISNFNSDSDEDVKRVVLSLIGEKKWIEYSYVVIQSLNYSSNKVRLKAIKSAKLLNHFQFIHPISKLLLQEKNKEVILEGISALIQLNGDPYHSLYHIIKTNSDFQIKISALFAIQKLSLDQYQNIIENFVELFEFEKDYIIRSEIIHTIALLVNQKNYYKILPLFEKNTVSKEHKIFLLSSLKAKLNNNTFADILSNIEIQDLFENNIDLLLQ